VISIWFIRIKLWKRESLDGVEKMNLGFCLPFTSCLGNTQQMKETRFPIAAVKREKKINWVYCADRLTDLQSFQIIIS
jgi:hypothetical protein